MHMRHQLKCVNVLIRQKYVQRTKENWLKTILIGDAFAPRVRSGHRRMEFCIRQLDSSVSKLRWDRQGNPVLRKWFK